MKTLVVASLQSSDPAAANDWFGGSLAHALSRHTEVRLVVPLLWWARVRRPSTLFPNTQGSTTGIRVSYLRYWPVPGCNSLQGAGMFRSLRRYAEGIRGGFPFDVILAGRAYPDGYAAACLAREFGCPLVSMVVADDFAVMEHFTEWESYVRQALGQSHRILVPSTELRDRVIALGVAPYKVIVPADEVIGGSLEEATQGCYTALASAAGISTRGLAPARKEP